jgi:hypothetical protein
MRSKISSSIEFVNPSRDVKPQSHTRLDVAVRVEDSLQRARRNDRYLRMPNVDRYSFWLDQYSSLLDISFSMLSATKPIELIILARLFSSNFASTLAVNIAKLLLLFVLIISQEPIFFS